MKRFDFRLEKALGWRAMQVKLAESEVQKLQTELEGIEASQRKIAEERERAGRSLMASGSATGVELAFLESFRNAATSELARLEKLRIDCRKRLEAQLGAAQERKRDERILEQLKGRKLAEWRKEFERELDSQASEAHLSRWNASNTFIQ